MTARNFASWADPSTTKRARTSRLSNPFAGFLRDLRQIGVGWRWGSGALRPRTLPPAALEPSTSSYGPARTRAVGLLQRVTGLEVAGSQSRVILAHIESPADLAVLMEALPEHWRVVTSRVPAALSRGRSVLFVTDFAAPSSADVAAEAAGLATRYGRDLQAVVVRRLRPAPADATPGPTARGPRPRLEDEVQVRFAAPIRDPHAAAAAKAARASVAALLAEDDATWWQVLRGQASSTLDERMAPWRRVWERTTPSPTRGRRRTPIWR